MHGIWKGRLIQETEKFKVLQHVTSDVIMLAIISKLDSIIAQAGNGTN